MLHYTKSEWKMQLDFQWLLTRIFLKKGLIFLSWRDIMCKLSVTEQQ